MGMSELNKVPYTPSQTQRFEVSRDLSSQERFQAIRTIAQGFQEYEPYVVGAILFGSLSKGKRLTRKTAQYSDIDLAVYIDPNRLLKHEDAFMTEKRYHMTRTFVGMFHQTDDSYDETPVIDKLTEQAAFHLDMTILLKVIAKLPTINKVSSYRDLIVKAISTHGPNSIYGTYQHIFQYSNRQDLEEFSQREDLDPLDFDGLALPWGFDITGGLRPYRLAFFERVSELDTDERELVWRNVNHTVRFYERQLQIPPEVARFYPETLEQAIEYYSQNPTPAEVI